MSTTTDQRSILPTSVTVLFPRQDSGVPAASPTAYTVTLASLALAESASPLATFVGSHVIWSSCVAYWTGGGSAANNTELQALANQIATDWYRWQLAPYDVALQGMVPWPPEGGHDLVFQHSGRNHCETRVLRGPWFDHLDQTLAKGTYGSSTPGSSIVGGTLNIVDSTVNIDDSDLNITGGDTTIKGPIYFPPDTATTIGGDTNNFTLPTRPVTFLDVTGPYNFTGIVAPAINGFRLVIVNTGNATLTLKNEDASSSAANRFRTPYATKADVLLPPNFACELQYDTGINRWRILWVSDVLLKGVNTGDTFDGTQQDDFAIDQRYPFQLFTVTGHTDLTGLANGKRGQWYYLAVDAGGYDLRLMHQDTDSAAGNRFVCPGSFWYTVSSGGGVVVYYDGSAWRVLASDTMPDAVALTDADSTLPVPRKSYQYVTAPAALTAIRIITLPSASLTKPNTTITIFDKSGALGPTNYLSVIRDGSDTINGSTSYAMQTPYSSLDFVSDGTSKWTVNPLAFGVEEAQDAVGTILTDSTTIDFTYNDGTPSITAAAIYQMSITADASGLKLSGDATSPGTNYFYGTNGGGTKGWYAQSSISGFQSARTEGTASAAGSSQGDATALTDDCTVVSGADGTKGVIVPNETAAILCVRNDDGANTLKVYPPSGAQFNSLGTNAAYSVLASSNAIFFRISSTVWLATTPL